MSGKKTKKNNSEFFSSQHLRLTAVSLMIPNPAVNTNAATFSQLSPVGFRRRSKQENSKKRGKGCIYLTMIVSPAVDHVRFARCVSIARDLYAAYQHPAPLLSPANDRDHFRVARRKLFRTSDIAPKRIYQKRNDPKFTGCVIPIGELCIQGIALY